MRSLMKTAPRLLLIALLLALLPPLALPARGEVNARELEYAYLEPTAAYLVTGEEVSLLVMVPDTAGLTFEFTLYYNPDRTQTQTYKGIDQQKESGSASFSFTPKETGQYLVEAVIYDAAFRSLKLQSEPLYCYAPEALEDESALPGKVKAIAREANAQNLAGDYETALWLHDWLTGNADYDEPMTIHTPEGVLLQGAGVCESYALAYRILLHEVGIDNVYVTGYSRGESHAWNLVKLGEDWVWVDPTWNDPVGGEEGYDYFGMNDALLGRDHDWSVSINRPPRAQSLDYNYLLREGSRPFVDEAGLDALLRSALGKQETTIEYTYHGDDRFFNVSDSVGAWLKKNSRLYFVSGYEYGGSRYAGTLSLDYQDMSGYTFFTDEASFTARMEELLPAKPALVKMAYTGEDPFFDFGRFVSGWLTKHHRGHFISDYSYSYLPYSGEITLAYKDVTGYQIFHNPEELDALLAQALVGKPARLLLYYSGSDEFFKLNRLLDDWFMEQKDALSAYSGSYSAVEAELDLTWRAP